MVITGSKICPFAYNDGIWQSGGTAPLIPNPDGVSLAALPPVTDPSVPTEHEASWPQHVLILWTVRISCPSKNQPKFCVCLASV
jgi:hypothetical protein